ncbi:RHS repeat-associated core domain-containing protein [Cellulosimicrobium cellulans]|uniref:RHS repeat-associated core domain-containing protein n=1 Tax=Cellulosimicrobium cellulans TaxID=1710 RepID=UPI001C3FBDD0|nr:RHS repeat-associated core domain-containing protein [Cellulosimicrobium cellulans]
MRHYTDGSDNPGYATKTTGSGDSITTWYGASIAGDLGLEITDTAATLSLIDPIGSIATTITLPAIDQPLQLGALGTWDEYGNPLTTPTQTGAITYSWLGGKERAQDTTGLTLMGARLYNPTTGLFTSVDPVDGGNTTAYTYPQDPINSYDLDGRINWRKVGRWAWKHRSAILDGASTAAMFVPGLNVLATGYKVYRAVNLAYRGYKMYRAVNKSVRYTRSAIKANRSYQYNRWSVRTIVRHGKRDYDSQNRKLTTFSHRGTHNGTSGTFRIVGNHRTGKIYHYGFHRD